MIQVLVGDETGRCKHLKIRQSNSDKALESSFEVSCINNNNIYEGNPKRFNYHCVSQEINPHTFPSCSSAVQGLVSLFTDSPSSGKVVASVRADSSADLLHFDGNQPAEMIEMIDQIRDG